MDWIEKAKKVYQERGYLVVSRFTPCRIGHIVTLVNLTTANRQNTVTLELPQPFQVVAETDLADYLAQHAFANEEAGEIEGQRYFYRVMTD